MSRSGRGEGHPHPSENGTGHTPALPPVQRFAMGPPPVTQMCFRVPSPPWDLSLLLKQFHFRFPFDLVPDRNSYRAILKSKF